MNTRMTPLEGVWEIASLVGNISRYEGTLRVHAHATVSDRSCRVRAGHLVGGTVAVTCEITLTPFEDAVERRFDEGLHLSLIDLSEDGG